MIQFDIDQFYLFPSCPSGIPGKVSNMGRNKIVILIRKELEIVFPIPIKTDIVFYKPLKVITGMFEIKVQHHEVEIPVHQSTSPRTISQPIEFLDGEGERTDAIRQRDAHLVCLKADIQCGKVLGLFM